MRTVREHIHPSAANDARLLAYMRIQAGKAGKKG
jgi:hypothetical protein